MIRISRNKIDTDMIDIYSISPSVNTDDKVKHILWGVVHIDFLSDLGVTSDYLDDDDAALVLNKLHG